MGEHTARYRVDKDEALRYVGYAGQQVDAELAARIDEQIASCEQQSAPGFVFEAFPVAFECDQQGSAVRLVGSSLLLRGESIAEHLHGARECAVMACTLGLANELAFKRLQAVRPLDAVLFGAAGSSLVECVADACEAAIVADAAARGLHANWRFSPGYGDLPLDLQPAIVRVLGADKRLGMSATSTNLLIPTKSVTAFVGLFDSTTAGAGVRTTCAACACRDHCSLRAAGTPCYRA